jgi:hypothetical protein
MAEGDVRSIPGEKDAMRRLLRTCLLAPPALATLTGCLNWQASYDELARNHCRALPDASDRSACLDQVEANARQKRADRRSD